MWCPLLVIMTVLVNGQKILRRNGYVTVIGKINNLSLTLFISKFIENNIYYLLIEEWGHKIDSFQFGGRKGYSVTLFCWVGLRNFELLYFTVYHIYGRAEIFSCDSSSIPRFVTH